MDNLFKDYIEAIQSKEGTAPSHVRALISLIQEIKKRQMKRKKSVSVMRLRVTKMQ